MIKGITFILKNDPTFQAIVGQNAALSKYKVYPCVVPQPELTPYSIVKMNSKRNICKGMSQYEIGFTVTSYHKNYDDVDDLDNAVVDSLVGTKGVFNGVTFGYIHFENSSDIYVETYGGLYGRETSFICEITYTSGT